MGYCATGCGTFGDADNFATTGGEKSDGSG